MIFGITCIPKPKGGGAIAHVEKYTDSAVANQIRHCSRTIRQNSNPDIDASRTHLNYRLSPDRGMTDYQYYRKRKDELHFLRRKDVKTLAGWIVTAPAELITKEEERAFFKSSYEFLKDRYGEKNIVCAYVHYDEGKMEKVQNRWGGYETNPDGSIKKRLVLGRPHLHFCFIPAVPDKNPKHTKEEKICAKALLNKKELQRFHTDLQDYLKKNGIKADVQTGITKKNGRNYTVSELKEKYEMEKELERLRKIEKIYKEEHQQKYDRGRW